MAPILEVRAKGGPAYGCASAVLRALASELAQRAGLLLLFASVAGIVRWTVMWVEPGALYEQRIEGDPPFEWSW
ncbi:MAG: hypothetical protein ACSLFM_06810 [Tepidiformaceae bacterium]